jgi:hypothetical protein
LHETALQVRGMESSRNAFEIRTAAEMLVKAKTYFGLRRGPRLSLAMRI